MLPGLADMPLRLVIAVPQSVVWLGIVVGLATVAARGNGPPPARRLAVASAVTCGVAVSALVALLVTAPSWYADWVGSLLLLVVGLCFLLALNCLIWCQNAPKSPAEQRLAFGIGTSVALLMVAEWVR